MRRLLSVLFRRLGEVLREPRGTTTVEFAVLGGVFIVLLLGTVEVARYAATAQAVRSLAGDAARAALLSVNATLTATDCGAATVAWPALLERAPLLSPAALTHSVDTDCAARTVTVTAAHPFTPVIDVLPSTTIRGSATLGFF